MKGSGVQGGPAMASGECDEGGRQGRLPVWPSGARPQRRPGGQAGHQMGRPGPATAGRQNGVSPIPRQAAMCVCKRACRHGLPASACSRWVLVGETSRAVAKNRGLMTQ